jgi:hypothetical protein
MRSRDFAVLVCNRTEAVGACLFCEEYERVRQPHDPGLARRHAADCPVAEYLRTEHARRGDKTQSERARTKTGTKTGTDE